MARFNYTEADNYGGTGGSGFFSLKDDGDKATVRLLYNDVNDIECFSVHQIEIDGKKRYVDCLRQSHEPVENCPFCAAGRPTAVKLIVPVYDVNEDAVKIWERGKGFIPQITSLCATYGEDGPIVSQQFIIVRSGKAGSKDTRYSILPTRDSIDDTRLEDFTMPDICGPQGFILEKSYEDMQTFLDTGHFAADEEQQPVRRTTARNSENNEPVRREGSHRTGRRTPSDTF